MVHLKPQALVIGLLGTGATIAGGLLLWDMYRKKKAKEIPNEWQQVGNVCDMYIYPVKSGQCVKLEEAQSTGMGLMQVTQTQFPLRDRYFVIYAEDTLEFVSHKNHPKILMLKVDSHSKDSIVFSFPDGNRFQLKLPLEKEEYMKIEMWNKEKIPTVDCGTDVSRWISQALTSKDTGLRIGFWSESIKTRRDVMPSKWAKLYKKMRNKDTGAYAHLSSFLFLNKASIEDMNRRIGEESCFSSLNFRPNLIVEGPEPYEEDNWDWIRIGDYSVFRNFKPCTRCSMTTIDPYTGVKNPQLEPIKTLREYRQIPNPVLRAAENQSPVMGIYVGLYREGIIRLGDPVYVA